MRFHLHTYQYSDQLPDWPTKEILYGKDIFRVYEQTPGYTPILIVACEGDTSLARLLAVTRRGRGVMDYLIRRCEVFGTGEYYTDVPAEREELFQAMLTHLTSIAFRNSWMITFRNLEDPLFGYKCFRNNQYFAIKWMRVLNSLYPDKSLMRDASPSRRRQIRRGVKSEAIVRQADTADEVQAFSAMLKRSYSWKVRRHFPHTRFFHHFHEILCPQGKGAIYIVLYEGRIIGGSVILYSGENAYLIFSGGMNKSYKKQCPGVLSVWKCMNEAAAQHCEKMEYIDAGLPFRSHGLREFALRFGAKTQSSRRWFRLRWGWMNKLLMRIYS